MPLFASLAQLVEQGPYKAQVVRSRRTGGTKSMSRHDKMQLDFVYGENHTGPGKNPGSSMGLSLSSVIAGVAQW